MLRCALAQREPIPDRPSPVITGRDDMGVTVDEATIHVPKYYLLGT
jgi:hypothetical protein